MIRNITKSPPVLGRSASRKLNSHISISSSQCRIPYGNPLSSISIKVFASSPGTGVFPGLFGNGGVFISLSSVEALTSESSTSVICASTSVFSTGYGIYSFSVNTSSSALIPPCGGTVLSIVFVLRIHLHKAKQLILRCRFHPECAKGFYSIIVKF